MPDKLAGAGVARIIAAAFGMLLGTLASGEAMAEDRAGKTTGTDTGGWQFDVASYGWFTGFKGTTATLPPLPAADVDLSFGDILSNLDGAVMGILYARNNRLVLYSDLMYSHLSTTESFATAYSTSLKLSTASLIASAGVGYSVVETPSYAIDVLAGARLYNVDTEATLKIAGLGITKSGSTNETWVDPMVGARFSATLTDNLYFTSWAFAGGFDVGSTFSWDLFGGIGYKFDDKYTMLVGYRGLGVDYTNGDYVYDVVQQGPIAGLKIHF
jgi:hypothetical protein